MIANGSGSAAAATADEARKMDRLPGSIASENSPAASANHRYTVARRRRRRCRSESISGDFTLLGPRMNLPAASP